MSTTPPAAFFSKSSNSTHNKRYRLANKGMRNLLARHTLHKTTMTGNAMKYTYRICSLVLCLLSASYGSSSHASQTSDTTLPTPHMSANAASSTSSTNAAPSAAEQASNDVLVRKGMRYGTAREALLKHGWTPVVDKQCLANVVGGDYKKLCARDPSMCSTCDTTPELSDCSSDGYCLMNFHNPQTHQNIRVTTYGDVDDRNSLMIVGKDVSRATEP